MSEMGLASKVSFVGFTPATLYLLERLSLIETLHPIWIAEQNPSRRRLVDGVHFVDSSAEVLSSDAGVVFFMDGFTERDVATAIENGKHVIIDRPWLLSSSSLTRLAVKAKQSKICTTYLCLPRWSVEFLTASQAIRSGRLGPLHSIRRISCERAIPFDESFAGAIKEVGFHWIDQMFLLSDSYPVHLFANGFPSAERSVDDGFLANITLANKCTIMIEIQTRSNLSFRSGWMLDGAQGAYRSDRLYTVADDGEIIDEPISAPAISQEEFLRQLQLAWQREPTDLPTLEDAARIVELLEFIEQSASHGEAVRLPAR